MRKIFVAIIALFTFAAVSAQSASAGWTCRGAAYVCNDNGYKLVKKRAARKQAYAKDRYTTKQAAKPKKKYTTSAKKKTYKKSKKYAKGNYGKSRYSGKTLYGKASFYWQPQRVASGGWFNPNAMTAAHKSLPFGTKVRVTNKHNGRSVVVKINDRGPYIKGRIIDLSKAAAHKIGMQNAGVVPVTVTVLGKG